jgi:hypothetical protein
MSVSELRNIPNEKREDVSLQKNNWYVMCMQHNSKYDTCMLSSLMRPAWLLLLPFQGGTALRTQPSDRIISLTCNEPLTGLIQSHRTSGYVYCTI